MGKYIINGGKTVSGKILLSGAKNSALPIIAASLLTNDITVLNNCPKISDTDTAFKILKQLGTDIDADGTTVIINSSSADKVQIPENLVKKMRSSIIFMGALISRFGEGVLFYPGGCELGNRPIDIHLEAFKKLGAKINENGNKIEISCPKIIGTVIELPFPSVGATENIILASVFAKGKTIIKNAAKEPEIYDLQLYLKKAGAKITGAGTDTITIEGTDKLGFAEHTIMPDRMEAGTYLIASTVTGGELYIENIPSYIIKPVTDILSQTGCTLKINNNSIYLKTTKHLSSIPVISTAPHPGFPTDMQPQLTTLLTQAEGTSIIKEEVFDKRIKHIPELIKMGANIDIKDNQTFIVKGPKKLIGTEVYAHDLRAGAALIIAGLLAEGKTIVNGSIHIQRGYENIETVLTKLGADIKFSEN